MSIAYFAFASLGIMWGTNFLLMKIAISSLEPMQIAWFRVAFGAIPILILAIAKRSISLRDLKNSHHFLAMALIANVLPFYLLVKGTQHLKSGIAGVMAGTVPLVTVLISSIFLPSAKISRRKLIGLILGFVGVSLVAQLQKIMTGGLSHEVYGAGFMLFAAVCFAGSIVYTKRCLIPLKLSAVQLSAYQTLFAAIVLSCITPLNGLGLIFTDAKLFWIVAFGLGFMGTGISYICFYYIIEKLGPITASSVYYIPPVVALLLGAVFARETMSLSQVLGSMFILAGIYFARAENLRSA